MCPPGNLELDPKRELRGKISLLGAKAHGMQQACYQNDDNAHFGVFLYPAGILELDFKCELQSKNCFLGAKATAARQARSQNDDFYSILIVLIFSEA